MLILNKYKTPNFINLDNLILIERPNKNNKIINYKNVKSLNYNYNFYNLFLRSFIYTFFFTFTYNPFILFIIKDKPRSLLKIKINIINLIDSNNLDKISKSDY